MKRERQENTKKNKKKIIQNILSHIYIGVLFRMILSERVGEDDEFQMYDHAYILYRSDWPISEQIPSELCKLKIL